MGMAEEVSSGGGGGGGGGPTGGVTRKGCFVMWQMIPNKWLIELSVGGHSIVAGSDGNVAWRHTPWLGSHAAKGAVRPLRRAFQASLQYPVLFIFHLFIKIWDLPFDEKEIEAKLTTYNVFTIKFQASYV